MASRRKMNKYQSRQVFKRGARRIMSANDRAVPMRGGFRI